MSNEYCSSNNSSVIIDALRTRMITLLRKSESFTGSFSSVESNSRCSLSGRRNKQNIMFRTIDYAFIYSYSYSTAQDRELALENGVETLGCDLLLPLADQVGRVQTQDHWSATQQ